jgi:DNA-directed RNA polymerase specialized sigma24 family protein
VLEDRTRVDGFAGFVAEAEPRLRNAFCAAFGADLGREATAEALAFGWEHWDRVRLVDNPVGYLWGVGRNKARRSRRPRVGFPEPPVGRLPWVEPGLAGALAELSERQRVVVMLVHGLDWSLAETAELLGVSKSTCQKHGERGMARLRRSLGVKDDQ